MKFRHRSKKLLELTEVDHAFVYVLLLFLCLFLLHLCATSLSAVGNSGGGSKLLTQSDICNHSCAFSVAFSYLFIYFFTFDLVGRMPCLSGLSLALSVEQAYVEM